MSRSTPVSALPAGGPAAWSTQESKTIEQMRRGKVSHRRNPLLADLFRRIDMVEAWGRGMPLILQNAPDAAFREIASLFVASFERPSAAVVTTPETGLEPPKNAKETQKKHTRNTKELVLEALQAQPDLTAKALALQLNLSASSVRHHLRVLLAAQRIRHVGPTKGGHWQVTDPAPKGTP